jgi:hypothetical protein
VAEFDPGVPSIARVYASQLSQREEYTIAGVARI